MQDAQDRMRCAECVASGLGRPCSVYLLAELIDEGLRAIPEGLPIGAPYDDATVLRKALQHELQRFLESKDRLARRLEFRVDLLLDVGVHVSCRLRLQELEQPGERLIDCGDGLRALGHGFCRRDKSWVARSVLGTVGRKSIKGKTKRFDFCASWRDEIVSFIPIVFGFALAAQQTKALGQMCKIVYRVVFG